MFKLAPVPKIITFDCYGTLVQWREVLLREIGLILASRGRSDPGEAALVLDMQACHQLGIRGIWINRNREQANPDWLPYEELPDLSGVPGFLLPD